MIDDLLVDGKSNDGTQAIRRAAAILKRIARATAKGEANLSEISASTGLSRSTSHRILKCLAETGLASYDQASRSYGIGPLSYELGLAVNDSSMDITRWHSVVDRIAKRTGVTAYLMRRSGIEAVCLHKADGTSMVRVMPVKVGDRRFLGVGAAAAALIAALDDATIEHILQNVGDDFQQYSRLSPQAVRDSLPAIRKTGFAVSRGRVYASIFGMGAVIPNTARPGELAVSIAAHQSEVNEQQVVCWKAIMAEELGLNR